MNRKSLYRRSATLTALAGLIATGLAATGLVAVPAQAASLPPTLVSMTLSTPSVDVTTASKSVTITVRATDPVKVSGVDGSGYLTPSTGAAGGDMEWYESPRFTLFPVSGSDQDRTFSGTMTLPAGADGVYGIYLALYGTEGSVVTLSPGDLAAVGQPAGVRVVTTAVPAKLAALSGKTETVFPGRPQDSPLWITRSVLTWTLGTGGGAPRSVQVVSKSSSCGQAPALAQLGRTGNFFDPKFKGFLPGRGFGLCTLTVRVVNGAGGGPTTQISFL